MRVIRPTWLTLITTSLTSLTLISLPVCANEPISEQQAVSLALSANPGLAAIEARTQALQQLPSQAGSLPEPSLSINALNIPLDSFSLTQEGMTQLQVSISQPLPYPGKLALASQAAEQQAQTAHLEYQQKRLLLARDVKTVWWNIFYLDKAIAAIKQNTSLLEQVVHIAQTRYEVGQGLQQDILLAQLELSHLRDRHLQLMQMRQNEVIQLNVLLDQPMDTAINLDLETNKTLPSINQAATLQQQALANQPGLLAQQQRIEHARTRVELAKKDYSPDFKLGAAYGLRLGDNADGSDRADFGSIFFSVNLPIYANKRQDRLLDQRNAEWLEQKYQLSDERNAVFRDIQQAVNDMSNLKQQAELYEGEIIPQAKQTVDAMLAGYQVGKVDFLSLVRSQTTLYNYETQYWKTYSASYQALARLNAAIGEDNHHE